MAPLDRTEKFQIRLTQQEKMMLEVVAEHDGLSASDLIRQYIRQRGAEVIKPPDPAATKRLHETFAGPPKRPTGKKKK
jgi:hypothetical protein